MVKSKKSIQAACLVSVAVMFYIGWMANASSQTKKPEDIGANLLPESQRAELVRQEDDLFIWMDKLLKQRKQDCEKAVAEIEDIIANCKPEKKAGFWRITRSIDSDKIIVFCRKDPIVVPQTAIKLSHYIDPTSGEEKTVLEYRVHYKDGKVLSFVKSKGETLVFWEGRLEGYSFALTENRAYSIMFDKNEEFERALITKPREPKEEESPEYELYYHNKNDLDILKNKLIHRLKIASLVARTKEVQEIEKLNNKSVRTMKYDIDFDGVGKTARFHRKSTGEEIAFHPNGKVKTFRIQLTDRKDFKAEWDSMGKLVKEQEIPR